MAEQCQTDGCELFAVYANPRYCRKHYKAWKRNGDPLLRLRMEKNLTCAVEENGIVCGVQAKAKGYCQKHLSRVRTHDDPTVVKKSWYSRPKDPSVEGVSINGKCAECDQPVHARGWCKKHHSHWLKYGTPNMMREFTCVICGKVWEKESELGLPPKVCSPECFKEMQRANVKKRRGIYNLPESELISLNEIYERDNHVCYLCGKAVDRKEASQDHVIPISKGGPHIRANIKLAHLRCNMIKHDRLITSL